MTAAIVGPDGRHVSSSRSVREVFGTDLPRLEERLPVIVRDSFRTRKMRTVTTAEIKRRLDYCLSLAVQLHRDMKWSIERIVDTLPRALADFLDGKRWEPSKRNTWSPAVVECD